MHAGFDGSFHLTHCTNIHPGERWDEVFDSLQAYVLPLKARLAPSDPFGLGLRLSAQSARALRGGGRLADFRRWLDACGLYVFTVNGFPYGSFHGTRVKDDVYRPDWTTRARVDYTLDLVEVLAALVPDGLDGGLSTSPLSYKPWLRPGEADAVFQASAVHLAEVAAAMARVEAERGVELHVDVEPEPHCLLEFSHELVRFFSEWLLPLGRPVVGDALGVGEAEAERLLRRHVAVCYDTCHFAVGYEAPEEAIGRFLDAGIRIGRMQLSSALKVALPDDPAGRRTLGERLEAFADPVYLHQVNERLPDGTLRGIADLPEALRALPTTEAEEWRIHYHVPLFTDAFEQLASTQDDLADALGRSVSDGLCRHLEIETYTWEVLPPDLKLDLVSSVEREYAWVMARVDEVVSL